MKISNFIEICGHRRKKKKTQKTPETSHHLVTNLQPALCFDWPCLPLLGRLLPQWLGVWIAALIAYGARCLQLLLQKQSPHWGAVHKGWGFGEVAFHPYFYGNLRNPGLKRPQTQKQALTSYQTVKEIIKTLSPRHWWQSSLDRIGNLLRLKRNCSIMESLLRTRLLWHFCICGN